MTSLPTRRALRALAVRGLLAALPLGLIGCGDAAATDDGATGTVDPCDEVDCNDDNPCTIDTCSGGTCSHVAASVVTLPQTAGDCKELRCDGDQLIEANDGGDLPSPTGACLAGACTPDPAQIPHVADTECNQGDGRCDGAGVCVPCPQIDCGVNGCGEVTTTCGPVMCGDCAQKPGGPTCTANVCGCASPTDCSASAYGADCVAGTCGCDADADCTALTATPLCDVPNALCVECTGDPQCATDADGTKCVAGVCGCAMNTDCAAPATSVAGTCG